MLFESGTGHPSPSRIDDMDDNEYDELKADYYKHEEDRERRVKEGLQLFADYYIYLWI